MANDFAARIASVKHGGRYMARFTDEQIVSIRLAFARGWKSANQLGILHGVSGAAIHAIVQGSIYKKAGGIITWPEQRWKKREWRVRGWCKEEGCKKPIADSGWPQRMHLCIECYRRLGGKRCGRTAKGVIKKLTCRTCKKKFSYYVKEGAYRPKCCSNKCGTKMAAAKRVVRPRDLTNDKLYELYWGQNMTTTEIAAHYSDKFDRSTVLLWLIAADIPRRAKNYRQYTHCIVEGCGLPRLEIRNNYTGKPYGRLCPQHFRERETRRRRLLEKQRTEARGSKLVEQIQKFLHGLPDSVKTDAMQEITLAVLCGSLALPLTNESVKPYIAQMFRENADAYKFLSLAAPTRDEEGAQTWGERLGLC